MSWCWCSAMKCASLPAFRGDVRIKNIKSHEGANSITLHNVRPERRAISTLVTFCWCKVAVALEGELQSTSGIGRYCCKSLFELVIKNSFDCTHDFRVKMWGTLIA